MSVYAATRRPASIATSVQARDGDETTQCVAFAVGDNRYCVDIMSVREIRNWTGATELPNTADYMRGVINLRGTIVPIIDLKARFGQGLITPTANHVIVVVMMGERLHGLLVDSVSDILTIGRSAIAPIPESLGQSQNLMLDGLVTEGDQMLALVALDRLLPSGPGGLETAARATEPPPATHDARLSALL